MFWEEYLDLKKGASLFVIFTKFIGTIKSRVMRLAKNTALMKKRRLLSSLSTETCRLWKVFWTCLYDKAELLPRVGHVRYWNGTDGGCSDWRRLHNETQWCRPVVSAVLWGCKSRPLEARGSTIEFTLWRPTSSECQIHRNYLMWVGGEWISNDMYPRCRRKHMNLRYSNMTEVCRKVSRR
jgi:hypothetical protein